MLGSLLITLREGLEAALIVGIVLAYLRQVGAANRRAGVWLGVAAAAGLSLATALVIQGLGAELEGAAEQIFEGVVMVLATGVLTWMIFWMARQARLIKGELQQSVDRALAGSAGTGLFMLAFIAVLREGIETALFLSAAALNSSALETLIGGLLGLVLAIALGILLYLGSLRLDLRRFFSVTGLLLLLFAAGLLAHGVHEFQEAGLLPVVVEHLWSTKPLLSDSSLVGSLLRSLFGYNDDPSLLEVVSYLGYLAIVGRNVLSSLVAPRPRVSPRPA